jgi:hypothetical protein
MWAGGKPLFGQNVPASFQNLSAEGLRGPREVLCMVDNFSVVSSAAVEKASWAKGGMKLAKTRSLKNDFSLSRDKLQTSLKRRK